MKISVFGLGCVGAVNSACLASQGHEIIGVDTDKNKIDFINQGKSPLYEPGLDELIQTQVNEKRLKAITDVHQAVTNTDISIICVGTPSTEIGGLELGFVENILTQIATVIRMKDKFHVVVMRSTVLPGTAKKVAIPILE
ncbi:MAG: GDP-mannose dehydrogenase, partial [Gammaproteobacteria bacterium]